MGKELSIEERLALALTQFKRERDEARQRAALLEQRIAEVIDAVRLGRLEEVERFAGEVLG